MDRQLYIPTIRDTTITMTCSPTRTAFPVNRVLLMLCKVWFIVSGFLKLVSLRGLCDHKFRNFYNMQYFFCVFLSHKRVLLYRFGKNMVQRVSCTRFCSRKSYWFCHFITRIASLENIVRTYMFQQEMEVRINYTNSALTVRYQTTCSGGGICSWKLNIKDAQIYN